MALLDKYSFEVDGAPVTPTNDRLQMEWDRKDGTRFFRKKLKTALRFTGADFLALRETMAFLKRSLPPTTAKLLR